MATGARIGDVPHTLGKLVSDRLDRLAPWVRASAETLAVVSDEVPVELLTRTLSLSEPRAELALRVLEEERVARRAGAGVWGLAHDEVRRLVYQGIPDERRRLLHEAVGLALEARGEARRPGGMARLAHQFDQAGDLARAHRYALSAAAEAGTLAAEEAERMLLEVAAASGPRALPPGSGSRIRAVVGVLRRHWVAAVGVALGLVALGGGGGLYLRSALNTAAPPGWRQGTVYFSAGLVTMSHRLRWPQRSGELGTVQALEDLPAGFPPRLVQRNVPDSNETHAKLFVARGRDTSQLTFGLSDDMGAEWAPDGRHILLVRGWRASETRYQQNVLLMDSAGRILLPLTESPWQDTYATWSPDGTQFTFRRDSAGVSSIWIADSDGSHPRNLTEEFGLPTAPGQSAFAPDGRRVAVAYADTGSARGAVYVVDLAQGSVKPLRGSPARALGIQPAWSPDGRWLAYLAGGQDASDLWVATVDDASAPTLVARVAPDLRLGEWVDGGRRYVDGVSLEPRTVELLTGRGLRANATARGPEGEALTPVMRWTVGDTSVAHVDSLGFVRGRGVGSTSLIASAGGSRADTAIVTVTFAPVDTLFLEDWSSGFDTTRWIPFGYPEPVVRRNVAPDGRSAFFNNGDYNHTSGAVSTEYFEVGREGVTLEVEVWLEFTRQHWQHLQIGFHEGPAITSGQEIPGGATVQMSISGPEPTWPARWTCATARIQEQPPFAVPRWWRYVLTLRPDGWCECWVDGRRVGAQPLPEGVLGRPLGILLGGLSVGTELYHGRVIVRRGMMY